MLKQNCKEALQDLVKVLDDVYSDVGISAGQKNAVTANMMAELAKEPTWRHKMGEFVINSYISGIGTPLVNVLSGAAVALTQPLLRTMEAGIGKMGGVGNKQMSEALGMISGMGRGVIEGMHFLKKGWGAGAPLDSNVADYMRKAIGGNTDSSKAAKVAGEVIRVPSRAAVATDEFFKGLFRRMEYNAQVERASRKFRPEDFKIDGVPVSKEKWKEYAYSQSLIAENGAKLEQKLNAVFPDSVTTTKKIYDFAKEHTFQRELHGFAERIMQLRGDHPELAVFMPFVKTPWNIIRYATDYVPGLNFLATRDLGGTEFRKGALRRRSEKTWGLEELFLGNTPRTNGLKVAERMDVFMEGMKGAQGNARAENLAKATFGAMSMGFISNSINNGSLQITGSYPQDSVKRAALQAAGVPEYSMKVGDRWVPYGRIEPFATVIGSTVDTIRNYKEGKIDEPKFQRAAQALTVAFASNMADKTFLAGVSDMLKLVTDPEKSASKAARSAVGPIVPAIVGSTARAMDPYQRDVNSVGDSLKSKIPGLRETLPIKSALYGGPMKPGGGDTPIERLVGQNTSLDSERTPVQKEAARVKWTYQPTNDRFRGVKLTPEEEARWGALSSQYIEPSLQRMMNSAVYERAKDPLRRVLLDNAAKAGRKQAAALFQREMFQTPEFRQRYTKAKLTRKGLIDDTE